MNVDRSLVPQQVDWGQELYKADQTQDIFQVSGVICDCVERLGISFQEIERELRKNRCYYVLIAEPRGDSYTDDITIKANGVHKTYHLYLLFDESAKEISQEHFTQSDDYKNNFNNLNDTGFLCWNRHKPLEGQIREGILLRKEKQNEQSPLHFY
jgi:hypothetical protein